MAQVSGFDSPTRYVVRNTDIQPRWGMAQNTVWVLMAGDYDSYRLVGVYSSAERANEVAEKFGIEDTTRPFEVVIDQGWDAAHAGLVPWLVFVMKDGTNAEVDREHGLLGEGNVWEVANGRLGTCVYAADKEQAAKVAAKRCVTWWTARNEK